MVNAPRLLRRLSLFILPVAALMQTISAHASPCSESVRQFLTSVNDHHDFAQKLELATSMYRPRAGLDDTEGLKGYLFHLAAPQIEPTYPTALLDGHLNDAVMKHLDLNHTFYARRQTARGGALEFDRVAAPDRAYNSYLYRVGEAFGVRRFQFDLDRIEAHAFTEIEKGQPVIHLGLGDVWSLQTSPGLMAQLAEAGFLTRRLRFTGIESQENILINGMPGPQSLAKVIAAHVEMLEKLRTVRLDNLDEVTKAFVAFSITHDRYQEFNHVVEKILYKFRPPTEPLVEKIGSETEFFRPRYLEPTNGIDLGAKIEKLGIDDEHRFQTKIALGGFNREVSGSNIRYTDLRTFSVVIKSEHPLLKYEALFLAMRQVESMARIFESRLLDSNALHQIINRLQSSKTYTNIAPLEDQYLVGLRDYAKQALESLGFGSAIE